MDDTMTAVRELAGRVDTAGICDVAKDVRLMSGLRCRSRRPTMCGPAVTVRCREDFLGVIQALDAAGPGDVLVVDGGGRETALAGELFARAAIGRGLAGIVVDGGYRDLAYVSTCELPVYSRHVTPMAGTVARPATVNVPVACGGVPVGPGDIVVADQDGIVVLDPATAVAVLTAAAGVKATEARVVERLDAGAGLGACVNLAEHVERLRRGEPSALRFTV